MRRHATSKSRQAFTLVELLVVIAVIGLLSTVAVVATTSVRVKSRNAKRITDIRQVVAAFGFGISAGSTFPSSGGDVWVCISSSCGGGWTGFASNATVDSFLSPYINNKVTDPSDGGTRGVGGYVYDGAWGGASGFPPGPYISYMLEGATTCGLGLIYAPGSASTQTQCLLKLD